jgi:hypothetical protein
VGIVAALVAAPPLAAQRGRDVQVFAVVLARDSSSVGAGVGAGLRFGRGLRLAASVAGGWLAPDAWVGRAEALLGYHLYPVRRAGAGWYLGGGVAAELARGRVRGLVVALMGVEVRPWRRGGLFAEVGVGGGARLAVGYRMTRLAAPR